MTDEATAPRAWRDPILVAILLASLVLTTHRIGHAGLHYFDESFHAIVARNLLKHPLRPTLVDAPYLPYDATHWGDNHVWLHKPILPLWTIAGSFALLGVTTFALRLPSALLATGAVALTYLIGRRLSDRPTALVAAGLQAINPAITMLVQGSLFSDHVDITLLFWVEVGVYFLLRATRSGAWPDVLAAGVAQGLAYLSKSYLAALLTGLAATAWLLPKVGLAARGDSRLGGRHLIGLVAATLATVAPWTIHCALSFPEEFRHEHGYVFTHLGSGVENWGGPWDRVFFDYLITLHQGFYTPILAAGLVLLPSAFSGAPALPLVPLRLAGRGAGAARGRGDQDPVGHPDRPARRVPAAGPPGRRGLAREPSGPGDLGGDRGRRRGPPRRGRPVRPGLPRPSPVRRRDAGGDLGLGAPGLGPRDRRGGRGLGLVAGPPPLDALGRVGPPGRAGGHAGPRRQGGPGRLGGDRGERESAVRRRTGRVRPRPPPGQRRPPVRWARPGRAPTGHVPARPDLLSIGGAAGRRGRRGGGRGGG